MIYIDHRNSPQEIESERLKFYKTPNETEFDEAK